MTPASPIILSRNCFICYDPDCAEFAHSLTYILRKQTAKQFHVYASRMSSGTHGPDLSGIISETKPVLIFIWKGAEDNNLGAAVQRLAIDAIYVTLKDTVKAVEPSGLRRISAPLGCDAAIVRECAKKIKQELGASVELIEDGLPIGYPFEYEKQIIDEYINSGRASVEKLALGCPAEWPMVEKMAGVQERGKNPLPEEDIGSYREEDAKVLVDTRAHFGARIQKLTFREAGPRKYLSYQLDDNTLKIGVIVSGGIAPGINAVIDGIFSRHNKYAKGYDVEILGYLEGFRSLLRKGRVYADLNKEQIRGAAELGGSVLGTSRAEQLLGLTDQNGQDGIETQRDNLRIMVDRLSKDGVHILYVIGGDGSMRAAHAIHTTARQMDRKISIVCVPKTMDNDVFWIWQSFGFMSAVERARDFVLNLSTEVKANPRLGIIQLFGSDSGFVASHAAFGADCDLVLIPEDPFEMDRVVEYLTKKLTERYQRKDNVQKNPYAIVVMAETAVPEDALEHLDDPNADLSGDEKKAIRRFIEGGRRVVGQTPDELRTAGLKIVAGVMQAKVRQLGGYWSDFRVLKNEPRHLIRSIRPSVSDMVFGERLGTLAVDNAMAGYTDFMISQWLTEFVLVPLPLVALGRKRVRRNGIFWKSVRDKTGQPPLLAETGTEGPKIFLCHNSKDKAVVKMVAAQLLKRKYTVWLDEWDIQPGALWQQVLQDEISQVAAGVVFVGTEGISGMQQLEALALMDQFVTRDCKIIPVRLSTAAGDLPPFLKQFHWIDLDATGDPITKAADHIISVLASKQAAKA